MRLGSKLLIGGVVLSGALLVRAIQKSEEQVARSGNAPADVAERELARWYGLVETDPRALPMLQAYWAAAGQPFPGPDTPWSGAFIAYVVRASDMPNSLLRTAAHIYYARQAYIDGGVPGKYGAYRPDEVALRRGDIIVSKRGVDFTFEDLAHSGPMVPTHGDIVVEVGPTQARAIGGNLGRIGMGAVKSRLIPHINGIVSNPNVAAVLRYQPTTPVA
jgi:hypothetical protein